MATTKGRVSIIRARGIEQLAEATNTAIEVLEASGFVAQACATRDEIDGQGNPVNIATVTSVHQDFMPLGILTADAAGRARMAAGFFGLVPASLAHFADAFWAASASARGKFADGLWDNSALAKFAAGLFSADDTARAKFVDNFWSGAVALAKFADDLFTEAKLNTDVKLTRAQIAMETAALPTATAGRGAVLGTGNECRAAAPGLPTMTVDVATGGTVVSHRGRKATVAPAAGIIIAASDIANPRWDVLVATEAGALAVREGAAGAFPFDPALTAGDVPLARVVVPAGATAIATGLLGTGWVVDLRNRYALQEPMTPGLSIGLPGGSTDISAAGINADLQITLNGVPAILTIADPGAFSIGGAAAVALDSAARIVAALQQLADQALLAVVVSYDLAATRYMVTSVLRGRGQSVTVQAGLVNNIADNLLIGTASGGEEHTGLTGQAAEESFLLSNPAPGSVDLAALAVGALAQSDVGRNKFANDFWQGATGLAKFLDGFLTAAKLAFEPVQDVGELSSFAADFVIGAFPNGDTIQIAAGDVWTGRDAGGGGSDPANRFFLCAVGAAADLASFVAAVNDALSPSVATALNGPGDTALLVAKLPTTALAGSSSHANCVITGTNALVTAADKNRAEGSYTLQAGDKAQSIAGQSLDLGAFQGSAAAPRLKCLSVQAAITGAVKTAAGVVPTFQALAGNRYALCVTDAGGVALADGDTIEWEAVW